MNPSSIKTNQKIYFFGTCLIDVFYPNAGVSAVTLLERQGVEVLFPQDQSCCGQPAYNSGYREEAFTVARKQLALFPQPIPIVVPSGSCAGMMKHHYPRLFAGHPLEPVALDVASRVYEFTEYMVKVLKVSLIDLGKPIHVALHTSCSSRREMHVSDCGQLLLNQLNNVTWQEPQRAEECCGFGGTFAVKQPEVSAAMAEDKCQAITDTGASKLVSGDCGCLMNLSGTIAKRTAPVKSAHIAEFLLERTQGEI